MLDRNIPAFPRNHQHFGHGGMDLRDYFAAKAMQPINSQAMDYAKAEASDMARKAYMIADAMMKARGN
jgi:hypothetical protein